MDDKVLKTNQHEGSHGIGDAVLIDLLHLGADNPICEGLAGALGEDGREAKSQLSFGQLLQNPYPDDTKLRQETANYAGTKYWHSLRKYLHKQNTDESQVWPKIFGTALVTAVDLSNQPEFMKNSPARRISKYLFEVPTRLGVDSNRLEEIYNSVSEN